MAEITKIVNLCNDETEYAGQAWGMLIILPNILLQRTLNTRHTKGTTKVHKEHLWRRLDMWQKGMVNCSQSDKHCKIDYLITKQDQLRMLSWRDS